MAETRKLVVFDSWTKGSHHVVRLLDALRDCWIDVVLVHVGSWGDDAGRPLEESINGLTVRDIEAYDSLDSVLRVEAPDAVLFLSLDPLLHRAFNRYCRFHDIPTVNLYPGLWSVQAYDQLSTDRRNIASYLRWQGSRLKRSLRYVVPEYVAALIRTRAGVTGWLRFVVDVSHRVFGTSTIAVAADARPDHACVFNEDDAKHAMAKYGLSADRVAVVGVPDIIKFRGLEAAICQYTDERSELHEYVLYIGTGVRGTQMRIADDGDYLQHLVETSEAVRAHNKRLVCKLHYSRAGAVEGLARQSSPGIRLCTDDEFVEVLGESCGAIIEPSSAALVPVLMGKPVYLAQYGRLAGLVFGSVLSSYPRAKAIRGLSDLSAVAEPMPAARTKMDTNAWIRAVAGPLPASEMPKRVACVIRETIERTSTGGQRIPSRHQVPRRHDGREDAHG